MLAHGVPGVEMSIIEYHNIKSVASPNQESRGKLIMIARKALSKFYYLGGLEAKNNNMSPSSSISRKACNRGYLERVRPIIMILPLLSYASFPHVLLLHRGNTNPVSFLFVSINNRPNFFFCGGRPKERNVSPLTCHVELRCSGHGHLRIHGVKHNKRNSNTPPCCPPTIHGLVNAEFRRAYE